MNDLPEGIHQNQVPGVEPKQSAGTSSCTQVGLRVLLAIWILAMALVSQAVTALVEQSLADGFLGIPDFRWAVTLLFGLAVLIPAAIGWAIARTQPAAQEDKWFYQAFALSGGFVILLTPARLVRITQAYETALILIAGMVVFLLLTQKASRLARSRKGLWAALLAGGIVGIPWVLWGALGLAADILLNLGAALLFGLAAGRILPVLYQRHAASGMGKRGLFQQGLITWLALLVMANGLGINGNQGLLAFAMPAIGWALAALYRAENNPAGQLADNRQALALLAGLAAFWPMAFVDPDELAAAAVFGLAELLKWTSLATFAGLATGIVTGILFSLGRERLGNAKTTLLAGLTGMVWVSGLVMYLVIGQPGLYGDRLFVILKEQADFSTVDLPEDYVDRRSAVYQQLVEKARTSQAALRQPLDRLGFPVRSYYLENALEVRGGPLVRWWLERRPEVDRVLDSPVLRPLPEAPAESTGDRIPLNGVPWNLTMIGADRVWEEFGATGQGILIGQADSGAQGDHIELADSYRGRSGDNDYNWYDPWYGSPAPVDIGGHGTHTLGTVVGNQVGVAPDAEWIGCVNLARNLGSPAYYLNCMEFLLAPFPQDGDPQTDGRPEMGAHILNNSWGCPPLEGCDAGALLPAVEALRAAGVFVVSSAGNDGSAGCETISAPISLYDAVYSVGAIDSSGSLAEFSSTGPVTIDGSQRIKPDITAPGVDVLSAFPGDGYALLSGTSMAGPHVVGVVALMWSANPDMIGDIDRTEQILNETAAAYNGPLPACAAASRPNNGVGYGVLDAYEAVKKAVGQ